MTDDCPTEPREQQVVAALRRLAPTFDPTPAARDRARARLRAALAAERTRRAPVAC